MRYKEYKKVDIPWLDEVPSHWEIIRAKNLYKKENRPTRDEDEVITCFRDGQVTLRKNRRTTGFTESILEHGYQGVRKGDLVIHVMDAFAGAIGVSDSDGKSTPVYNVCNGKIALCNEYYAYLLRIAAKKGYIQSLYKGIRERSSDFRFDTFQKIILPVPPKEEQEQMARFLDWKINEIDGLIIEYKQKIQNINKLKYRLIANEYNNFTKKMRLKMILDKSMEYGLNMSGDLSGNFRYVRITDIDKNGNLKNNEKLYVSDIDKRYILSEGDILFARSGATVGKTYYYKEKDGDCAYAGYLIRATINKDIVFPEYIYYFTQSGIYEEWKNAIFIQSTIQNISAEKYSNLFVPMVDKTKQIKIIEKCRTIIDNINKIEKKQKRQIDKLKQLKQSLISDVVTGKIDVRNVFIPEYDKVNDMEDDTILDENFNEEV